VGLFVSETNNEKSPTIADKRYRFETTASWKTHFTLRDGGLYHGI
jgi:hypothetical protein